MIREIEEIHNLGRFEGVSSSITFDQKNVLFGFNGTGKSTLSELFYSLIEDQNGEILQKRKTLPLEDGTPSDPIMIKIKDDVGTLSYNDGAWNRKPLQTYVFNNQFINDYVFVDEKFEEGKHEMIVGKEAVKLVKEKRILESEIKSNLQSINNFITKYKEFTQEIKAIGKQKVTSKGAENRCSKIASVQLYTAAQKKAKEDQVKNGGRYYNQQIQLEDARAEYIKNPFALSRIKIAELTRLLKKTPKLCKNELTEFMSHYVDQVQVNWYVTGLSHQKQMNRCPFCGQKLIETDAVHFISELKKEVREKTKKKALEISHACKEQLSEFQQDKIAQAAIIQEKWLTSLKDANLLLASEAKWIDKNKAWNQSTENLLEQIIGKIYNKISDPYKIILITDEEQAAIEAMNAIADCSKKINEIFDQVNSRLKIKMDKLGIDTELHAMFELSYGTGSPDAHEAISSAQRILRSKNRIIDIDIKLDDLLNELKLDKVNHYLKELNVNFSVIIEHKHYYVKLQKYQKQELDQNKENLVCSEGEQHILALAYFLTYFPELEDMGGSDQKIVFFDDPVNSLDLSRRSIVAYWIARLMRKQNMQTFVLTHDVAFVEAIQNLLPEDERITNLLELDPNGLFKPFALSDYLMGDKQIYKKLISEGENGNELERIIALMSLRPLAAVSSCAEDKYNQIESLSSYFAHTQYATLRGQHFQAVKYDADHLKSYVNLVGTCSGVIIDAEKLVGNYCFTGFTYETIRNYYIQQDMNDIMGIRKKALLLRPLLEACLFQLVEKKSLNAERIGSEYNHAINNRSLKIAHQYVVKLKELYDLTKKYHHGTDEGSYLGIAFINPQEMDFYNKEIIQIMDFIEEKGIRQAA